MRWCVGLRFCDGLCDGKREGGQRRKGDAATAAASWLSNIVFVHTRRFRVY